jgi:hypothetical protein
MTLDQVEHPLQVNAGEQFAHAGTPILVLARSASMCARIQRHNAGCEPADLKIGRVPSLQSLKTRGILSI